MDDLKINELIITLINADDEEETSVTFVDDSLVISPFNKVTH